MKWRMGGNVIDAILYESDQDDARKRAGELRRYKGKRVQEEMESKFQ
jgi:hypothetical protein